MKNTIARRYAEALYDHADELKMIDTIMADFKNLKLFMDQSPVFSEFIGNASLNSGTKKKILFQVFNTKFNSYTFNFLNFLNEKNRLNLLDHVIQQFEDVYSERKNSIKAKIISAVSLRKEQIQAIVDKLKLKYKKDIIVESEEDTSIIAGFKIKIGDHMIDNSVKYHLDRFKNVLIHS